MRRVLANLEASDRRYQVKVRQDNEWRVWPYLAGNLATHHACLRREATETIQVNLPDLIGWGQ